LSTIDDAVQSKLKANGEEDALALWRELWAAYTAGGEEGAEAMLSRLLAARGDEEGER
jgi:hypothetical protein